jgi:hypothetical protein
MADPHYCQSCQFCVQIHGKNNEILRIECWRNPPTPLYLGPDTEGKPKISYARVKVEPGWKCGEWKEKKIGYW